MAPNLSKPERPPPGTPAEMVELATRKARPLLEILSQVLQSGLSGTGEVVEAAAQKLDQCARATVRLLEGLCCFDIRKYVSGPNPPKLMDSLAPLLVLLLISLLYNAFVLVYMPSVGIALASPTSMIFHAFIFLAVSSFVKAAQTDPGGIPNSKEWYTFGQPPPHLRERKHGKDEPRWCRKSEAYKPDRAHYSTAMRRVVLKFDHHCPWLGNTMGHGNYKFFFLFLLYATSACVMFDMNIIQLLVHLTLPAVDTFVLLGAEVLTVILTSILVPFTLFHAHLISRNMTTCEYWCKPEGCTEEPSPYDRGLYDNICAALGESPLLWFLPVGGPKGDGLAFPRASDGPGDGPLGARAGSAAAAEAAEAERNAAESGDERRALGESGGRDCESGEVAAAALASDGGECFLAWQSAGEFVDDVRVGCEAIEEVIEDAARRFLSMCAGALRPAAPASARRSKLGARGSKARKVQLHGGGRSAKPRLSGSSTAAPSVAAPSALPSAVPAPSDCPLDVELPAYLQAAGAGAGGDLRAVVRLSVASTAAPSVVAPSALPSAVLAPSDCPLDAKIPAYVQRPAGPAAAASQVLPTADEADEIPALEASLLDAKLPEYLQAAGTGAGGDHRAVVRLSVASTAPPSVAASSAAPSVAASSSALSVPSSGDNPAGS